MRAALLIAALSGGCLASPPSATEGPGARADASGLGPVLGECASGSQLDLVYVDRISVLRGAAIQLTPTGLGLFANPREDTILLGGYSAAPAGGDPNLVVSVAVGGQDAILLLPPGEAKGTLTAGAATVVTPGLSETWSDSAQPTLSLGVSLASWDSYLETDIEVPLEVAAGDYRFSIVVTLVDDSSKESGTPLSAARATATCP